jgi:two-component system chemotaxis response regulator CheY
MFRLLVVDDSNIIRRKISRSCNTELFDIVGTAQNGADAVTKFMSLKPQVMTMDLTMPEMDGIRCVESVMRLDDTVRILVISALSDVSTGIEALEKGARGFLCKPFTDEQLNEALEELVEGMDV